MANYPGSNWWAFDFHNHTPASSDYCAAERGTLLPRDWLLAYMRAGVDCVAITDHNTGDWIDRLQNELDTLGKERPLVPDFRPLHLFPGVELTTSDGLHLLAIYGPNDSVAKIHGIKALAECDDHPNNAEGMCKKGAADICDLIHSNGGIVVLAHVEEENGILFGAVEASGKFVPKLGAREVEKILERCDALEGHNLAHAAFVHFAAQLKARAMVDGSDAHATARAGARRVWLKMAQPCIEGLKLALLDPDSSVVRAEVPPSPPAHRITSISVEQLHLRRQRLDQALSPWFNSLIGGRGSGKSTILETLRLALAREHELQELGDDSDVLRGFRRFRQIGGQKGSVGMIRAESVISAIIEKHDVETQSAECYRFTWRPTGFEVRRLEDDGITWADTGLNMEQAASLFPVKVFSQKQVFELADRPSALLSYIDSAPEVGFDAWAVRQRELSEELRALRNQERWLKQAISRRPVLETELKEVTRKTQAYQQSKMAEQVNVFRQNQHARQAVDAFVKEASSTVEGLEHAIASQNPFAALMLGALDIQKPNPTSVQAVAAEFTQAMTDQYEVVLQAIRVLRQRVDSFQGHPIVATFLADLDAAMAAYRQEVDKLKAEGIGTAQEAEAALKRRHELETALAEIAEQEKQLASAQSAMRRAYARLKYHRRRLTRSRQRFVERVLRDNANLRIKIDSQADMTQSVAELRTILRLQDGTFVDDIYLPGSAADEPSGLLGKLISSDLHDPTHKRVTSLKIGILERNREILGQALHGRLLTALGRLSADDDDALLEWFPADLVAVEFKSSDSRDFRSVEHASAGEKTSAILSFLLAHGDEPLLLDQPEDDLDNALVSELVVHQIRHNKSRRQIVVVTHNPNIVVNGDAELVLPMSFAGGQIQINDAGGLQERGVRQRICDVMEGGREAFRQRYKRILEDLDATR